MAKKAINIGLVGYKFMGKAHSNAYRQVGRFFPELEVSPVLKAICGRDEQGVREAADSLGWESYETDWRKLIARDDIDVIDIATPGNSHVDIAIEAAKAGKHVFCEKPIATEAGSAKRMFDAVNSAGVKHAVFFNYRKAPAVALAKQLIEQGVIGDIFHWRGTYLQDWIVDPDFPLVWRLRKEVAGSGSHGDLAAHLIDSARYLVGEIAQVTGLLETFIKDRPEMASSAGLSGEADLSRRGKVTVDDQSLFLARFESGATGSFEATRLAPGRKNYNRFEINGSKGSLVFNMERMNELEVYTEDNAAGAYGFRTIQATAGNHPYAGHYWPVAHIIGYEHTFINFVYDALHAIANDQQPSPNFLDGYINNLVLDAVERSSRSGNWEKVQ
ncbi:MAG: Gfo/Idh/MocA family oxidoreductase [Capsulimonadaceae bacterium]|nr:Gfo/Idh/MocA family oxidoreductase [Capsulimonadaceae bacterium]